MSSVKAVDNLALEPKPFDHQTRTIFGFWAYLMTDCILFAALFATYAVLHNNTYGGPSGRELFDMPYVLKETLVLLTSSFTCGLGIIAVEKRQKLQTYVWFIVTMLLGLTFLTMELKEFHHLAVTGDSWHRSGFLSSYFTLVGTHGLHITIGLLWMVIVLVQLGRRGFTKGVVRRLTLFSMFWHFLDIIWIFIFTIVYLMGALQR